MTIFAPYASTELPILNRFNGGAAKRHRETKQRQIVLEAVQAHRDHPCAEQIYEDVCKIDDKISRGTVYRNLGCLAADKKIYHVRVPGADRYDSRTDSHYHIICMRCGTVEDVPLDYREDIDLTIAEMTGYVHLRHRVVFEGLCNKCLKVEAENGRSRRYLALKDEVKEAEQIRKGVYAILREENRKEQPTHKQDLDR